jgi:hypothetical protein
MKKYEPRSNTGIVGITAKTKINRSKYHYDVLQLTAYQNGRRREFTRSLRRHGYRAALKELMELKNSFR